MKGYSILEEPPFWTVKFHICLLGGYPLLL